MELFTPDFGLVFWMFVAFLVLFLILYKWAWPGILKSMDDRAELIDKGVEYARDAKTQLDSAREEGRRYIAEAQKQQADMLRDAAKIKSQIIEEAKSQASVEAQKVMDNARQSIEQQRKEAELQFRNEVSKFSLEIAQKIMREQLSSEKAQTALVNKMIDEIEKD